MMVTGDYYHTSIAVGRGVGMIGPTSRLVIIQTREEQAGRSPRRPTPKPEQAAGAGRRQLLPQGNLKAAPIGSAAPAKRKAVARAVSFATLNVKLNRDSSDEEESEGLHMLGTLPPQERAKPESQGAVPPTHGSLIESGVPLASSHGAQSAPSAVQSAITAKAVSSEGLALSLDNGDAYQSGDMLQGLRALSEVRILLLIKGMAQSRCPLDFPAFAQTSCLLCCAVLCCAVLCCAA